MSKERGPRNSKHEFIRVRMPVTVMGQRARTLVDVCPKCLMPRPQIRRRTCFSGIDFAGWQAWKAKYEVDELTPAVSQ